MENLPNIDGLRPRRKADREKIAAAFAAVAYSYGAYIERRDEPAHAGWSGPAIVLNGHLNGVGFLMDIDDLHERHSNDGGLLSWYNAPLGRARDFSARLQCAAGDYSGRRHHKASSVGDWPKLLERFNAVLGIAAADGAFVVEEGAI